MENSNVFDFEVTQNEVVTTTEKRKMRQAGKRFDDVNWSDYQAVRMAGGGTSSHATSIYKGDLRNFAPGLLASIILGIPDQMWQDDKVKHCAWMLVDQHYFLYDKTVDILQAIRSYFGQENLDYVQIENDVFTQFSGRVKTGIVKESKPGKVVRLLAEELNITVDEAQALINARKGVEEPTPVSPALEIVNEEVVTPTPKKGKKG